jgi:hypothetical protein
VALSDCAQQKPRRLPEHQRQAHFGIASIAIEFGKCSALLKGGCGLCNTIQSNTRRLQHDRVTAVIEGRSTVGDDERRLTQIRCLPLPRGNSPRQSKAMIRSSPQFANTRFANRSYPTLVWRRRTETRRARAIPEWPRAVRPPPFAHLTAHDTTAWRRRSRRLLHSSCLWEDALGPRSFMTSW